MGTGSTRGIAVEAKVGRSHRYADLSELRDLSVYVLTRDGVAGDDFVLKVLELDHLSNLI